MQSRGGERLSDRVWFSDGVRLSDRVRLSGSVCCWTYIAF